ncbi:cbb3-type cytochrome c oxidase N-terminal domain-containing protein [Dyadobacter sp. CY312]|uniref:cbb3-type cytochrome c oxidase N-terminal domain-containing protein n=1 Tax=Dyadobacter sp. CY312 TaxID=2907303 RepID=UPI001F24AA03|nr:cbb3-type cytochrome c oxidase N-terminal domain-containing protein [Dyadobacter sp. CY312]MCE7040822.1 c-type cytochrome [Dyadobacter sp. CY312]
MKFRTYLENIVGIEIFPLISLIIFFGFFISLLVFVFRIDKKSLKNMSSLPLNDGVVKKGVLSVLMLFFVSFSAFAQDEAPVRAITGTDLLLYILLGVLFFVAVLVVILLVNALSLLRQMTTTEGESKALFSEHWWKKFAGMGIAIKDEQQILIEGHDYDGIQELDNRMPPWLQSLFVSTIVIAIGYSAYYFGGFGDMQIAELEKDIAQAEIEKKAYIEKVGASMDENSVTELTDDASIGQGQALFTEKCAACHGPDGGGTVGPNLTDAYWLHGGSINDLFKVIKYGVPEKGMISWEKQLSPTDIQKVASFVLSIKGTKPANPKEPQGELVEDKVAAK